MTGAKVAAGKIAFVTGGARGIGFISARAKLRWSGHGAPRKHSDARRRCGAAKATFRFAASPQQVAEHMVGLSPRPSLDVAQH